MPKTTQHKWIAPMLATLTSQRVFGPPGAWLFERKFDGFRAIAYRHGSNVRLFSRNQKDFGDRFPEIVEALKAQPLNDFIIDGEIVAAQRGRISFQQLQQRLKAVSLHQAQRSGIKIIYCVFDLLYANGYDSRDLPLRQRKRILKDAISFNTLIRYTPHRSGTGAQAYKTACQSGWEGLIAKVADAPYVSGRSRDWLKVKFEERHEFVIGGYTDPQGARAILGALLVGYYEHGKLKYAGKVGTGYSVETLKMLGQKLAPLEIHKTPFDSDPALPRARVHWVKPKLVAEVQFSEWTRDGKLRHPQFLGLRPDKSAAEVVRERPQ